MYLSIPLSEYKVEIESFKKIQRGKFRYSPCKLSLRSRLLRKVEHWVQNTAFWIYNVVKLSSILIFLSEMSFFKG